MSQKLLQRLRKKVEKIDKKIIDLLALRSITTIKIQILKREMGFPLFQEQREKKLLDLYQKKAQERKVEARFIKKLFTMIFSYAKKTGIMK